MEEKIEDILENNTMYDGVLNKTKAITELFNLFSVSKKELEEAKKLAYDKGYYDGAHTTSDPF